MRITVDHKINSTEYKIIQTCFISKVDLGTNCVVFDPDQKILLWICDPLSTFDVLHGFRLNYSIVKLQETFEIGDTICINDTGESFQYDGKEFVDGSPFSITAKLDRLEAKMDKLCEMLIDVQETLGYFPGNSEYEQAKERFESRAENVKTI